MIDELHVDGWDSHEHAECISGDLRTKRSEIELRHCMHRGPGPQRAAQYIDDPMHVMHRQKQRYDILRLPLPGGDQRLDLCRDIAMGRYRSLGFAGGPTGKNNHRPSLWRELRQRQHTIRRGVTDGSDRNSQAIA